jgi:hypothetical protein
MTKHFNKGFYEIFLNRLSSKNKDKDDSVGAATGAIES